MQNTEFPRVVHVAFLLLIAVLTVHSMIVARMILLPLVWALFISLLILPAVQWLEQKKIPRPVSIITVLIVVTILISAVLYILSFQVVGLLKDIPAITDKLDHWILSLEIMIERNLGVSHDVLTRHISGSISEMLSTALLNLRNSLFSIFQTLTLLSVIPLYIFFMLYYRDQFYEGFSTLLKSYKAQAHYFVNKIIRVIQRYLTGLMAITAIMAVIFYITLTLLGLDYALFFAVFLAIFNLIPYVGVIIASLAVILYAVVTSETLLFPVVVLVFLWLVQVIENNLITPYILGSRVRINPLVALIAIFTGGSIWGVSGMILFIPLLGILRTVFAEIEKIKPLTLFLGEEPEEQVK